MVVKDLHCWEIKAYYSDYLKETSVIFSLKALPDQPFGFSPSRGFYFEGFQKLENEVKKIQTQGPVNRF